MFKKALRNQRGFTLIEIIAVLVILGILAAVAIPKYLDMQNAARAKAAQGAIAEVKGRASSIYATKLLELNGSQPAIASVVASVNAGATAPNVGTDFVVTIAAAGTTGINITVGTVQGVRLAPLVTGIWAMPTT